MKHSAIQSIDNKKLTLAKVFHFSSNSFAMIPPSNIFKCSGFVPAKIIIMAELQSEIKSYLVMYFPVFKIRIIRNTGEKQSNI